MPGPPRNFSAWSMAPGEPDSAPDFLGIRDRRILVIGGSGGIGKAVAVEASRYGARVIVLGRDRGRLDGTLEAMSGTGHMASEFDLRDLDGIHAHVLALSSAFGGIDSVVHAAGIHSSRPVKTLDSAHIADVLSSNTSTALLLAQAFRDRRVRKTDASMVLVSSVMATVGQAGVSAYAASKGAISALTRSLSVELLRDRIRVNCVEPGIVLTEMTERLSASVGPEAFGAIESAHLLGVGRSEDVANAILFLLSDAAKWITGTSLVVDGGYVAR